MCSLDVGFCRGFRTELLFALDNIIRLSYVSTRRVLPFEEADGSCKPCLLRCAESWGFKFPMSNVKHRGSDVSTPRLRSQLVRKVGRSGGRSWRSWRKRSQQTKQPLAEMSGG